MKKRFYIIFILIAALLLFSGCSATFKQDDKVLVYENSQIVKDYEKEKKQLSNPQIDKDDGYCPLCEL